MTRYEELLAEMQKLAQEYDSAGRDIDPFHALHRVAHTEELIVGLAWILKQTLIELTKRAASIDAALEEEK